MPSQKADFITKRIRHYRKLSLGSACVFHNAVTINWIDISLSKNDISQSRKDISRSGNDISQSWNDVSQSGNDILLAGNDISPRNKTIALTIYRSIYRLR